MIGRPLELDDPAFWTDPRAREEQQGERLSAEGFRGLLLDGPSVVPLAERRTLPLAGWWGLSGVDLERGGPRAHAVLVGACLETGEVRAQLAFAPAPVVRKRAPLPAGARVVPTMSCGYGMFELDARERLGLPWAAGTWCFRVLLRDHVSDPVRVRLEGPPGGAPAGPAAPWPPEKAKAATWRDVVDAPPLPGRVGIALAADRALVPQEPDARWRVRLAWRLAVRRHERLDDDRGPKALVPITLVVVDTFLPGPRVVRLSVPCHDLAGDEGTGQLEVDLLKLGSVDGAGTAFIYAVAGEALSGPALTALVAADALPRDRRSP